MKVCFVGVGSIGKRHIRNMVSLSEQRGFPLEIHLLRSSHRELDKDISDVVSRECYGLPELDGQYDAIFVTNPTYLHYQTMLELTDKSDFFFVEKPVFDTWETDITPFVADRRKVYYVACPLRYTNVILRAKELLYGRKVISVRSISSSYLPDWRPGTDYRNTYSAHKDQGGGVMIDLIHEWDYLSYLFGFPHKVFRLYGKYSELEIDSEDIAVYIAEYDDKIIELHLDYFGRQTRRSCEVITTEGVYVFDIANSCVMKDGVIMEQYNEHPNDKYMRELDSFCELLNGNISNTNDICHAVKTMRIACTDCL